MALLPARRLVYKDRVSPQRHFALTAFLIALLFGAQASFAAHKVDGAAHITGEQCECCIAGNSLTGAPPAAAMALPFAAAVIAPATHIAATATLLYTRYRTRAPPSHFS